MLQLAKNKKISMILFILSLWVGKAVAHTNDALQVFLEQILTDTSDKYNFPGVAALIQINGIIVAEAVHGVRTVGHQEAVTVDDRWHIGSNTKALTATMMARLIEHDVIRFEDTLASAFPAFAKEMNPVYQNVTIMQLLNHTAGLPPLTESRELIQFEAIIKSENDVLAQRKEVARFYLTQPPASAVGSVEYSNLGFIIAGAIAEAHTGKSWEELISEYVFAPLGITNAGFGAPGSSDKFDHPRGHEKSWRGRLKSLAPDNEQSDNFKALGPAGTINISLKDWMRFAQDQLDGVHGRGKLLKAESYRILHSPVVDHYALGWGAVYEPADKLMLLAHSGSNGYWLAEIRIMPKHDIIVLIAMNSGDDAASKAVREIRSRMIERLKPFE